MTQFKDKSQREGTAGASVGLFTYPVLMAADILVYQADQVPVGDDQRQHLELTRDLATRFNSRFGDDVHRARRRSSREARRKVMDLQSPDKKMSKSLPPAGCVNLLDDPSVTAKKIRSAVTDTGREVVADAGDQARRHQPARPSTARCPGTSIAELEEHFAGRGYGDLKKELAEVVTDFVTPVRARTARAARRPRRAGAGARRRRGAGPRGRRAAPWPRSTTGSGFLPPAPGDRAA